MHRSYGTISMTAEKLRAAEDSALVAVERLVQRGGDIESLKETTERLEAASATFVSTTSDANNARYGKRAHAIASVCLVIAIAAIIVFLLNSRR